MTPAPRKKVAVVTGGSSGIGLATASSLLDHGYRVAFFGQRRDHVTAAEQIFSARFGAESVFARTVDLAKPIQLEKFFHALERTWAMPDILVSNAGISPKGENGATPFAQITSNEWHSVLAVNLTGAMRCCQAVLPHMIARDFGRIVFMSSIAGRTIPRISGAAYAASKAALSGLARSLVAASAGHGITVNLVAPGRIATGMAGPPDSEINKSALARIPVGRIGMPEDVAAAICFLISEQAGFINGAILDVNGGEFAPL
ncbi:MULTISPECIES: 3-oxoacyl-ACP reductase FabG [unclassified Rhizobium]|uniref:3-oxoacyl-ACP reductase FabG n=1 Tax=unclassified Rhizobium TaxID=2613769 RepID=UPI00381507C7